MEAQSKLLDDMWRVRLFHVDEVHYEAIDSQNKTFPYWVVSFIADGHVEVTDGNIVQTAKSGQVMLHAPGLPFGERAEVPGWHRWMIVEVTNSYHVDLFRLYPISEVVTLQDTSAYSAIFTKLLYAWRGQDTLFREIELSGLGLQLIHMLLDSWDRTGRICRSFQTSKNDERLHLVMSYMNYALQEKITRQTLADQVHLNANYLDRIFAEKFQMNPMQMLRELRLKKAKKMLENSDGSLAEIAIACGLGDASYLSHQFFKSYGINPGKYREQVRQVHQDYY